jgi:RNA polymerase sigma-70 factor (ECF subfamily)
MQDAWVERLRARDPEALREVVEAFGERLTAVVSGILRDRDAVDDVVQQTFAKAWFRIAAFKGGSSLYTWLYRVGVNAAKDHIKARRRRPAVSFDDLPGRAALPDGQAPLLEGLEQRELRLRVRAAIHRLPHRFRAVLALREIEGMTYGEIAESLALSLGTVESRLFRARQRLRALLEDAETQTRHARAARKEDGGVAS